jgi:hypothetical protein
MDQGMKGIGLFFAGWILALTAYYLGALDTGIWVPLAVSGVEIFGLILILFGVRQISDQHHNYKYAQTFAALAFFSSLCMGILQVLSLEGIVSWMAIAAICLAPTGDVLFMILTGLILLGICDQLKQDGNEREANRLSYLWVIFLTFAVLYLLIQTVAILLVNEGLSALTYIVPAMGLPLLVIGAVTSVRVYRIYELPKQEKN